MKAENTKVPPAPESKEIAPPAEGSSQGSAPPSPPGTEELVRELEEARRLAESYKDQLLRKAAEFENYKRRTDAESLNMIRYANEGLLSALLPIIEDFSRSFRAGGEVASANGFAKGIELIYQKLTKALEQQGLVAFDSLGKPFNVEFHDALLQIPRSDVPPGTVVEEVAQGYMLHDKVLRHAKVIVSAAPEAVGTPEGSSGHDMSGGDTGA